MQLLLARFDLLQSIGKPLFQHFKLNATDKISVASAREKNYQLPAAVRVSKTSVPQGSLLLLFLFLFFFFGGGGWGLIVPFYSVQDCSFSASVKRKRLFLCD